MAEQVIEPEQRAIGWRWMPAEPVTVRRAVPIAGSIAATTVFTAAEAVGRHRRRRRLAQPGWRPLGPLVVVRTNLRYAVRHRDGTWFSLWLGEGTEVEHLNDGVLVRFPDDPPCRLRWV